MHKVTSILREITNGRIWAIHIYARTKNEMERSFNVDMLSKAETIRCIRRRSLVNEEFDFLDKNKQSTDFLAYFKNMYRTKDQKWDFFYQHSTIMYRESVRLVT